MQRRKSPSSTHHEQVRPRPLSTGQDPNLGFTSADQDLDFFLGNAIKYICRAGSKEGESEIDDLTKAAIYIRKKLELIASQQ